MTSTVCAVGNRKNDLVGKILNEQGVEVYPGSLALLKSSGGRRDADGGGHLVGQCGCGPSRRWHRRLCSTSGSTATSRPGSVCGASLTPIRSSKRHANSRWTHRTPIVIEDAISGVQAGKAGGFGLVIGVDRHGDAEALKKAGADLVVSDLGELV